MNIEAMIELRRVAEAIPPEQFDMGIWESDCGTEACLAGWATRDPYFTERGLTMHVDMGKSYGPHKAPEFGDEMGFSALRAFFEIGYEVADHLFDVVGYQNRTGEHGSVSKADVLEHIDQVLEGRIEFEYQDDYYNDDYYEDYEDENTEEEETETE